MTQLPPLATQVRRSDATEYGTTVTVQTPDGPKDVDIYTDEGFEVLSHLWTRSGWQRKLSYELTWTGIPIAANRASPAPRKRSSPSQRDAPSMTRAGRVVRRLMHTMSARP